MNNFSMMNQTEKGVSEQVASGTFRLNSRFFDEDKLKTNGTNPHKLSLDEKISRPTILKYLREPGVDKFSGDVLFAILVNGFGIDPAEITDMRIGDIFEIVSEKEVAQ